MLGARVTAKRGTVEQVKAAILQYANGERGFIVGGDVSPFEIVGAINLYRTEIFVRKLLVARGNDPLTAAEIIIAKNERPSITLENIAVVIDGREYISLTYPALAIEVLFKQWAVIL